MDCRRILVDSKMFELKTKQSIRQAEAWWGNMCACILHMCEQTIAAAAAAAVHYIDREM